MRLGPVSDAAECSILCAVISVGLTGGIGSGKSEVARRLAAHGAMVIDTDRLAREAVAPGTPGLARVVEEFGPDVLLAEGTLDRAALGRLVFADAERRSALEHIVHPYVRRRSRELAAAASAVGVVVHEVPLLVEKDLAGEYDVVVVVDASDAVRLDRLVRLRRMDPVDAGSRMAAQATRDRRLAQADLVVENEAGPSELDAAVDELWRLLTALAGGGTVSGG